MSKSSLFGVAAAVLITAGCAPLAITALGVGGATAVNHTLTGIAYKTFTSLPRVKSGALAALDRMGIKVHGSSKEDGSDVIRATGNDRNIEVQLEPISAKSTRMRVTAKQSGGLLYDSATATEIIIQTDKILGSN
jgi:hypothetical protein